MGIGAIVLGVFAMLCALAGALLFWVPFLGTMLSFLAPVLSLAGIILGGIALSRAKAGGGGESEGFAIGGLVTSIIALIPSMLVALTCGACNVCATGMYLDPEFGQYDGGPAALDGGVLRNAAPAAYPTNPTTPAPITSTPFPPRTDAPIAAPGTAQPLPGT